MTDPSVSGGRAENALPAGTSQRIRKRAVWAVALFAASILPILTGLGMAATPGERVNVAFLFALALWVLGVLAALLAAVPTLRHWDGLPSQTRWLGALPLLTISLFLSVALVAGLIL